MPPARQKGHGARVSMHGRGLPPRIASRLRLPLIAAPMLRVSGPRLVEAACRAGVVGAFPAVNARSTEELDAWLTTFDAAAKSDNANAPYCANLIMRHDRLRDDLACLIDHRVEMVITSVGSPAPVVGPLRDIGTLVLADVATLSHVDKAVGAGVDGVVLLSAGAGGQTGWLNPFAFVRAVREKFDGVIVLAGGMSDGTALYAATVLGCDLGYMGTKFIATSESLADVRYKGMLVDSTMDDIHLTRALTGIPANVLVPSIQAERAEYRRSGRVGVRSCRRRTVQQHGGRSRAQALGGHLERRSQHLRGDRSVEHGGVGQFGRDGVRLSQGQDRSRPQCAAGATPSRSALICKARKRE